METLKRVYSDPASPAGFSGFVNLYKEAKTLDPTITKKLVREFLDRSRTYTLFKPRRVNFLRSKIIPAGYMTDANADLADFQTLAAENDGHRYLLVLVDVLSRTVYVEPVRKKATPDMKTAFDAIFNRMPMIPHRLFTDQGTEFTASNMKDYFRSKQVDYHPASAKHTKAATAERMIRTIKSRLYRYFSQKNTTNWVDVIQRITGAINRSKCRITGMRPTDVNFKNASLIWDKLYAPLVRNTYVKPTKFKPNDTVRVALKKATFQKGYLPTFTDEIFRVNKAIKGKPDVYLLEGSDGGPPLKGKFYGEELGRIVQDEATSYRIEKVLKKRRINGELKLLVKFIGYPENYWISEKDLEN